jgi:hypothetical protein
LSFARIRNYRPKLTIAVTKLSAVITIPPAAALLLSSLYKPPEEFLGCIHDLPIYIIVGSLAVLWVSWTVLFPDA